ncbi:MAG: rRNA pseudouridine synthase [Firmicutes bacterium]|nr:rRNA pseudouridine synthase [Bacillota bacterium]
MRINKYLASCGIASRRKCEEIISQGRVKLNDGVVRNLATIVKNDDVVELDGNAISPNTNLVYIVLNKPRGYVTTCSDDKGRKTVMDLIRSDQYKSTRLFPVGRLDYDTSGLLLLTNDGDWARIITHPSSMITKTYVATLDNEIKRSDINLLERGVLIDDHMTQPAKVTPTDKKIVQIVISEGRNKQVRKMFETLGYNVEKLERIAVGNLTLAKLKIGEYKSISKALAYSLVKGVK